MDTKTQNPVLLQMEIVRKLVSIHNRLRQNRGIPLAEHILDIAYGGTESDTYFLFPEYRRELAKACNVANQGYDLADINYYEHHNGLSEKPKGDHWICEESNGLYFCINNKRPEWLEIKNKNRKEHRQEMAERKRKGIWVKE